MASIEIILRDDEGKMIGQKSQKQYVLPVNHGRIGEIQEAVEGFNRASLADITYDILAHAQQRQSEEIKKQNR
jgi:hypothetical protein